MSVLTLRLAGPMQSWGASARFTRRTTERAPTKSGVLGLLAAAQGRDRGDDLSDLAALAFGVRIDQPGTRLRDFHTAHHGVTDKAMPISDRFYLADAVFVAAVEGEHALIAALNAAVMAPHYLPFLGRRSCPPSCPVDLNVYADTDLFGALRTEPWQASKWVQRRRRRERRIDLELITDLPPGEGPGDTLRDQPVSFDPQHRSYGLRSVHSRQVTVPNPAFDKRFAAIPNHDPMPVLEGD